jgi:hypothetical protein
MTELSDEQKKFILTCKSVGDFMVRMAKAGKKVDYRLYDEVSKFHAAFYKPPVD